jgi:hypothetical protein
MKNKIYYTDLLLQKINKYDNNRYVFFSTVDVIFFNSYTV